ncbi:HEAT repeat domain-containing protein [Polaribacter aestuariivivens]|uniref:HEAT repeat domain-containing protein n=1 Tax=Polaribacter aestuariivivens TaxID=2304626 RepID=A0A5S3N6W0_9FLAO|nr:HEAT repeat domain-containing protein [Polaribacter aestuariivivens]TMM31035.1 HEAT repeat domain-containing protein [Polaribacter aestuariivivens]
MKIKEFIQEHKAAFTSDKMSSNSDANFEALLKSKLHQPKKQKLLYLKYISIAACFAVVIASIFWFQNTVKSSQNKKELLANLNADSAGKRLEGVYKFNDEYEKEDKKIINRLCSLLHKDDNANVKIATIDALLKFPSNEKIRKNLIAALENEETPLVQIKLIKALSILRENRAQKPLEKLINNEETFPIVKNNATLAMVEINK